MQILKSPVRSRLGAFFASLPSLDISEHPQLPNVLFVCMIWPRQCSRVWHADHHRCCGADTNVEISDVYDPRVSAQAPPASTDSFTKTISSYPYLLAIVCNSDHSKLALTLQLLSYSVLKYPPCGQTVVLSRFDLLPHSQRIHNMEKRLQQTGKLT